MNDEERALTVLHRQTQWALDAAARDVLEGRLTPERAEELAAILHDLGALVGKHGVTVVIEGEEP